MTGNTTIPVKTKHGDLGWSGGAAQFLSKRKSPPSTTTTPPPRDTGSKDATKKSSTTQQSPSPASPKQKQRTPLRDIPRRITVATAATKPSLHKQQKRRSFPLHHTLYDSTGHVVWEPPSATLSQFPTLHAAAVLDPQRYTRSGSGSSIHGADAARTLLRGKRDCIALVRSAIRSSSQSQCSVRLVGHGVPRVVLEHVLQVAATEWLQMDNNTTSVDTATTTTPAPRIQSIEWTQERTTNTVPCQLLASWAVDQVQGGVVVVVDVVDSNKEDQQSYWQPLGGDDHREALKLYWTVMHRIATHLGWVVLQEHQRQRFPRATNTHANPTHTSHLWHPAERWSVRVSRRRPPRTTTSAQSQPQDMTSQQPPQRPDLLVQWNPAASTTTVILHNDTVVMQFMAEYADGRPSSSSRS